MVSAPSGAGKTTLCSSLSQTEENVVYATSYTTRRPRSGEVDGKDYFFISEEAFQSMIRENEFAEWA
ncbi:MAG TPA: guanylate kinase, partial [Nitrospiria bacterium]|nr:guanylate kinase [Nitrospiria bacterium]